jgi:hypothetical protein
MKFVIASILIFLLSPNLSGQNSMSYTIGFVVSTADQSMNTGAYVMSGKNCITISNGLSTFMPIVEGVYDDNCLVKMDFAKVTVSIRPNPIDTYTIIKFNAPKTSDNIIKLMLFNEIGKLVQVNEVLQSSFYGNGYKCILPNHASGVYYLNMTADHLNESYKLFKL